MSDGPNPYDAPIDVATLSPPRPEARPRGITILAILAIIGGVGMIGLSFIFAGTWQQMRSGFAELGLSPLVILAAFIFLGGLTLASGIGMWQGLAWGWWLGCFYYVHAVFRNASTLLMVASMSDELASTERGLEFYYWKHAIRLLISGLLIAYFFRQRVLDYFGLNEISKLKALGILSVTSLAILAFFSLLA